MSNLFFKNAAAALVLFACMLPAKAGTIEIVRESASEIVLSYKGPVSSGDSLRMRAALAKIDGDKAKIIELDIRGGGLYEAIEIGRYLNRENTTAVVRPKANCFSPCPLIFVGARKQVKHSTGVMAIQPFDLPAREERTFKVADVNSEIARTQRQVLDVTDYLIAIGANTDLLRYYFSNPKPGAPLVLKNEMLLDLGLAVHDDDSNELISPRRAR